MHRHSGAHVTLRAVLERIVSIVLLLGVADCVLLTLGSRAQPSQVQLVMTVISRRHITRSGRRESRKRNEHVEQNRATAERVTGRPDRPPARGISGRIGAVIAPVFSTTETSTGTVPG
jgi:hypothetical protein